MKTSILAQKISTYLISKLSNTERKKSYENAFHYRDLRTSGATRPESENSICSQDVTRHEPDNKNFLDPQFYSNTTTKLLEMQSVPNPTK